MNFEFEFLKFEFFFKIEISYFNSQISVFYFQIGLIKSEHLNLLYIVKKNQMLTYI